MFLKIWNKLRNAECNEGKGNPLGMPTRPQLLNLKDL